MSGWSISANPSTANGGFYAGWEPYGVVDNVTSGSGVSPFNSNAAWHRQSAGSSYNAFIYYPGELYNYGSVVGGAQPGASLTMTTTGINAAAVTGTTYTATIQYANVSWSNSAVNTSANVALNILANGVVVGTGTLSGLAQISPWTPVTATWTATSATLAKRSNSRWWRPTSSRTRKRRRIGKCRRFAFANATFSAVAAVNIAVPDGSFTDASGYYINSNSGGD